MKLAAAATGLVLAPLVSVQSYPSPCAGAGVCNHGAPGYAAFPYTPCWPGLVSGYVAGEWGKFCLAPGGGAPPSSKTCYETDERNQGASGYPAVPYMPCCDDGDVSVKKSGTWGFFCAAPGTVVQPAPTDTNCYKTGERQQGASGYSNVPWKPCCDKDDVTVGKEGTWGLFCTASGPIVEPTAPPQTQPPTTVQPPTQPPTTQPPTTQPPTTQLSTTQPPPPGPCEGLNSQRPHLFTISDAAWSRYERAVLALKASGVWDRFVSIHSTNSGDAHGGSNFLVWHRAFLWELEKELDAVVPGARIPWYDWSSVENPPTNSVWAANRLGSANTNGAAAIQNGPFQAFDTQLTRDGDLNVAISDRQFILDGINGGLDYAAFNNWLEVVHGAFHVAVGGSMGRIDSSPLDPVFFTHHAYIDAIYREWQNAGGGNQFTGAHSGIPVNAQTVMQPFGRQAGGVLAGISSCVSYVGGGFSISRQVVFGNAIAVAQGAIRGGDGDVVKKITKEAKTNLLLVVAEKKIRNPGLYKFEVKQAVEKVASIKKAALEFGISSANVVAFEKTVAVLKLQNGIDIAEPDVVDESDAEVQAEGKAEVEAIGAGRIDLLKPSKILEGASNTITTSD